MKNWKELGKRLLPLAPTVGAALGGPAGAIIGATLAARLNVSPTPTAISEALRANPEAKVRLDEMSDELAMAYISDIQDAREEHKGHWMPPVLTLILGLMMAALGVGLFWQEIPGANRDMANIEFGSLLTAFGTAVAYWLGSSRGSAEKQQTIDRSLK